MPGSIVLTLLKVSVTVSVIAAALLLLSPILSKTFAAKWKYWIWLVLAVRLLIPFSLSLPQAPVAVHVPEAALTQPVTLWQANDTAAASPLESTAANAGDTKYAPVSASAPSVSAENLRQMTAAEICPRRLGAGGRPVSFVRADMLRRFQAPGTSMECAGPAGRCRQPLQRRKIRNGYPASCGVSFKPGVVESPLMLGFIRPVLLVPCEDYGGGELAFILKHELTHFRRRDLWYKLLLVFANAVHWFNPFVWLMRREACADLELSCDDEVVKGGGSEQRRAYSEAVLSAIKRQQSRVTSLSTYFLRRTQDSEKPL
jgi:beta-lactamase regulating signal transducer with metallopeptidase domain